MTYKVNLSATVSADVPLPEDRRRDIDAKEIEAFARESAEAALLTCFERCPKIKVTVTATAGKEDQ